MTFRVFYYRLGKTITQGDILQYWQIDAPDAMEAMKVANSFRTEDCIVMGVLPMAGNGFIAARESLYHSMV